MVDFDKAFFDIDVRGAIFAHRAQLHEMVVRREFFYSIEDVERPYDVVCLRENGVLAVNHRIRRRTLFSKVYDCLRLKYAKDGGNCFVVHRVANVELNLPSRNLFPRCDTLMEGVDGG